MGSATSFWRTKGTVGILESGPLQAFAECDPDGAAFVPTRWKDKELQGLEVLGGVGRARLQIAETYVRGNDLVADCAHAGEDRIAPQLYWRAELVEKGQVARVELVLSVRTELLDSAPIWTTNSFVTDSMLYHANELHSTSFSKINKTSGKFNRDDSAVQLFVFRIPRIGLSYSEMIHPSDFVSAEADGADPPCVRAQLFPERLEKGVIRRARICGWFMPAKNDLETAVELAKRFVDEPLPLTA